jgi:predicted double-glycine peptidase
MEVGGVKGPSGRRRQLVTEFRQDGREMSLVVPRIEQATGFECGNTSLAAVAQFFGRPSTPAEFARLANTRSVGTDHADMVAAAKAAGAQVEVKANGTVDELASWIAKGVPPIVGWWSMEPGDRDWRTRNRRLRAKKDCGHYSVVVDVTDTEVRLMDPQLGPRERFTRNEFLRVWYDTDTHRYVKVARWFLAMRF